MSAFFSDCGRYRYRLERHLPLRIGRPEKTGVFLMLNPSSADGSEDDQTIRRCLGFADKFEWTRMVVYNLFAAIETKSRKLKDIEEPIGPLTDLMLELIPREWPIIAAWGAHPMARERGERVRRSALFMRDIYCLGTCKDGAPRHPLFLPKRAELKRWEGYGS